MAKIVKSNPLYSSGVRERSISKNIENRIFVAALIFGISICVLAAFWNVIIGLPLITIIPNILFLIVFSLFYWFSKYRSVNCYLPSIVISLFVLSVLYILNGGLNGSVPTLFIIALLAFIAYNNSKYHLLIFSATTINLLLLIWGEKTILKDYIVQYPTITSKEFDLGFGYLAGLTLSFVLISYFKKTILSGNEELKKSEERYSALFNNMNEGFAHCKLIFNDDVVIDYEYVNVNRSYERIIGFNSLIGKRVSQIFPNQQIENPEILELCTSAAKTGKPEQTESFIVQLNKWFFISVYSFKQNEFIAIISDITERKLAEIETVNANRQINQLKKALDQSDTYVYIKDVDCKYVYANEKTLKLFNINADELVGTTDINYFSQDTFNHIQQMDKQVLEYGVNTAGELEANYPDGSRCVYWELKTPIFDEIDKTKIVGLCGISTDITERKLAEDEIKSNYALLRIAGETAKFGGWSYDVAAKKVYWSDEVAVLHETALGYSPDLMEGLNFYTPEFREKVRELFSNCLSLGIKFDVETQIVTAKGNKNWVRTTGEAMRDENGNIVKLLGSFQDISRSRMKREMLKLNEMKLTELNATKDKLLSIIAHDLRSPLNNIIGYANLLRKNVHKCEIEKLEIYINNISNSAKKTFELLEDLLLWAKTQADGQKYNPESFNLSQVILETIDSFSLMAEVKGISITTAPKKQLFIVADKNMLKIILRNLISNAIKFTPYGGKIKVSVISDSNQVDFKISDNGLGMDETTLNSLFKIEKSISTRGTAGEEGTGLGLILCKEFVNKHGGEISVVSELGSGSSFCFSIPVVHSLEK